MVLPGARLRALRHKLDRTLAFMVVFSMSLFALFMVVPLGTLIIDPLVRSTMDTLRELTDYPYVNRRPLGSWLIVVPVEGGEKVVLQLKDLGIIPNTLLTAVSVTVLATLIGFTVALVMARFDFPGKTLMRVMAIVPLLYTPFVNAFVAYKLFGDNGVLGTVMMELGLGFSLEIRHLAGMILAQTMMFWPIVYLNTYASMVQIDPSLEEQAENLGARGLGLVRSVTLPLSLPGIASGAALVFIFSMEDLAAPLAFKVDNVISIQVVRGIVGATNIEDLEIQTAVLAAALLVMASAWFIAVKHYVSLRQYAMIVRGGRWKPRTRRPGPLSALLIYFAVLPWIVFSMSPQIGVVVYAFSESWIDVAPSGVTLGHFESILTDDRVVRALRNSLAYSAAAVAIIILLGFSSAYAANRARMPGSGALDVLATIPIAIPGLAFAMGLLLVFGLRLFQGTPLDPFNNPAFLLVIAFAIRKSPFTTRAVYAGLQQVHVAMEEAGLNLGASRPRIIRSIVAPLIGINVLSGALISFVYCMTEVSTSITIGSLNEAQAPLTFIIYEYLTGGYGGGDFVHLAAAMATLLLSVQLVVIVLTNIVLKQRYAFIGV